MTTEAELRDLLAAEAAGPPRGPGGWDDVTRRGRRRARRRRVQTLAVVALVAGVAGLAIAAVALPADDASVRTGPPPGGPTTTVPVEVDPSTVVQTDARITRARSHDASLTLYFEDLDPCRRRPVVVESEDQISVGLVGQHDERGIDWTDCDAPTSPGVFRWGTVELAAPVAGRRIVDLSTGLVVDRTDDADLLFPTSVPAPFDIEDFTEPVWLLDASAEHWSTSFTAEYPEQLNLYDSTEGADDAGEVCNGQVVEVRGTDGCFSEDDIPSLSWVEDGRVHGIYLLSSSVEGSYLDDLVAIADGLEPRVG